MLSSNLCNKPILVSCFCSNLSKKACVLPDLSLYTCSNWFNFKCIPPALSLIAVNNVYNLLLSPGSLPKSLKAPLYTFDQPPFTSLLTSWLNPHKLSTSLPKAPASKIAQSFFWLSSDAAKAMSFLIFNPLFPQILYGFNEIMK